MTATQILEVVGATMGVLGSIALAVRQPATASAIWLCSNALLLPFALTAKAHWLAGMYAVYAASSVAGLYSYRANLRTERLPLWVNAHRRLLLLIVIGLGLCLIALSSVEGVTPVYLPFFRPVASALGALGFCIVVASVSNLCRSGERATASTQPNASGDSVF